MDDRPVIYGLMAEYTTAEDLVAAAERAYAEGYRRMDAYSPLPVEGLAEAIGFRHNRLPLLVLIGGITGGATAYGMIYFSAVLNYPINVGGRGLNSWPAFIPIMFEMTILFAAFAAVFGMLGLNGLPLPYHPVFNDPGFALASQNRFFLCIESRDPRFDPDATRRFLEGLAPKSVSEVIAVNAPRGETPHPPARARRRIGTLALLAWALASAGCAEQDMVVQPKYKNLQPSTFFANNQSARPVEPGTVARGQLRTDNAFDTGDHQGKLARFIPLKGFDPDFNLPDDEARAARASALARGQERYNIFCSPCHARTGDGNGMIVQRGFSRPPSLHDQRLRDVEPGHFFHVITNGYGAMYSYASRIPVADRWAIVAYIRALQLTQDARPDDLAATAPSTPEAPPR